MVYMFPVRDVVWYPDRLFHSYTSPRVYKQPSQSSQKENKTKQNKTKKTTTNKQTNKQTKNKLAYGIKVFSGLAL